MKNDTIILSYPFSGSMYHFFTEAIGGKHRKSDAALPYYATLWGTNPEAWRSITQTFLLMYPNIIIKGQDNHLPRTDSVYETDFGMVVPELGLTIDMQEWNPSDRRTEIDELINRDESDPIIQRLLGHIPEISRRQIIRDVRWEIIAAKTHDAKILCAQGRKPLFEYFLKKDSKRLADETDTQSIFIEEYLEISALEFIANDVESLYDLKQDSTLQSYSASFRNLLENLTPEKVEDVEAQLPLLIEEAKESSEMIRRRSTVTRRIASINSWVGLFPFIGSISSALGIGLDAADGNDERKLHKHEWYDFAPQLSAAQLRAIQQRNIERRKNR